MTATNHNNELTRNDFMRFFRDNDKLNTLSVEDRIEIFSSVLPGSTDFTKELLESVLTDYCVSNLEVKEYPAE